ncbi:hypothetical protein Rxyl_1771 [Rubrobacter xylanophilus DSM 9941]|uniref:Uncharacterized protein n=1 Tax=Rubrobacter xylanophilus (strain DSM 9941 / JCM 11954 / NBRC 16129 / PRD-1) TaxID=266117 RepID=Q1AV48_RUBXD|nr:hypothetical protein [Rubrobacter xylanophilus]ABG04730.1 hypothetical protein Rxyl_1771 [Rubrobacter xylanophilus DSM 9941]
MTRGLLLAAALVVVVLAAANRRAIVEGGGAAPAHERAAVRAQRAPAPSEAGTVGGVEEVAAREGSAGEARTKRLRVENMLQVGGFGCASCQQVVEGILRGSDGVEKVAYGSRPNTYVIEANDDFRLEEVARRVRSVGEEYNRRLGLPDSRPWILEEVREERRNS